jgi:hypothetical protein
MIKANDERFNYIRLPTIYSKSRRVTGDASFGKYSTRRELFKVPDHQPMYSPKYDFVLTNNPHCKFI